MVRFQYRITWQPPGKPTASRVFRHRALALEFLEKLHLGKTAIIAIEEREVSPAPWRPSGLEGAR
jgi:hypothetical protein